MSICYGMAYTYDSGGNRTMSGYTTGSGNRLTASPGHTYTYDDEGNRVSDTNTATSVVTSYTYDYHNRLTGVTVGGTVVATYVYDAPGRRIGVKENGTQTWTVYDGQNPYADFNGSGTLQQRYLYGPAVDQILARTSSGGTTAWYLPDRLGTVRDVADPFGTVLDHIVYDSFGSVTGESNSANGDRFKFTGREYDSVVGIYYYRARYYDAQQGRFLSQDPKGFSANDVNLYRYVHNSGLNATDPSGLQETGSLPVLPDNVFAPTPEEIKEGMAIQTARVRREAEYNFTIATAAARVTSLTSTINSWLNQRETLKEMLSANAMGVLFAQTLAFTSTGGAAMINLVAYSGVAGGVGGAAACGAAIPLTATLLVFAAVLGITTVGTNFYMSGLNQELNAVQNKLNPLVARVSQYEAISNMAQAQLQYYQNQCNLDPKYH